MILRKALKYALFALVIASVLWAGAFALSEGLLFVDAGAVYEFTPATDGTYAFNAYMTGEAEASVKAELYAGDALLARGEGRDELFRTELKAGESCRVEIETDGPAAVEMARCAFSRCPQDPLELSAERLNEKLIARAGDVHWYAFDASRDGAALLSCLSEEVSPRALFFDENLRLTDAFEPLGSALVLRTDLRAGGRYLVRIDAPDGGTGVYTLGLDYGRAHTELEFETEKIEISAGSETDIFGLLAGEPGLFTSSNTKVCRVTQDGILTALAPGTAVVTAADAFSDAYLTVCVRNISMTALSVATDEIVLSAGDSADIPLIVEPWDSSDQTFVFTSEDEGIVRVDASGIMYGLREGETFVTVENPASGLTARVGVRVRPAGRRYRALLVAEEHYPEEQGGSRKGAIRSMQAIEALLRTSRFEDTNYAVNALSDLSRTELTLALRALRGESLSGDVTIFYLSCHGFYEGGMSFFELSDGTALSARDLERELRRIPGTIVVMLDCCGSGGAIGRISEEGARTRGMLETFPVVFSGTKYKVFASSALDEDSLRVRFQDADGSTGMTTLFARVLCEGGGWDIDRSVRSAMRADVDYDGDITLRELADFMRERTAQYVRELSESAHTTYRQTVQFTPEGDGTVLLRRAGD